MVTILCGDNSWAVSKRLHELTNEFVEQNGDLALERFDGAEAGFDQILGAIMALPFLAERKMVVVRHLSENSELVDKIEDLLAVADDSTGLVIVEDTLDKRKAYYKILKKAKGFNDFTQLKGPELARWVINEANNHEAHISMGDAMYLVERVGENQSLLASEVDKLALFNPQISRTNIDILTIATPESKIFDLLSAAFTGNKAKALDLYKDQRMQKVEPHYIMSMMAWQLHQISLAKSFAGPSADLARETGISPYSASKSQQLAASKSFKDILQTASALTDLEYRAKTSSVDVDEGLKTLIVSL